MDLRDAFALTGASIRTHKLRSVLAAIGVVLGIGSVVGVVTMGAGFQETILGSFTSEFDADLVNIVLESPQTQGGPLTFAPVSAFTDRDVERLSALPHAGSASARGPIPGAEVAFEGARLEGVSVEARRGPAPTKLDTGRPANAESEAVASNLTALHLMSATGRSDILGTKLTLRYPEGDAIRTTTVVIVGVERASTLRPTETLGVDAAFAPRAEHEGVPTHLWRSVQLRATPATDAKTLREEAQTYVETESDATQRKGERFTFRYDTAESVTALISTAIDQFTAFIGALGVVALVVGLVGIANIMLVSVSERTREIGVMKATGARKRDVILIFLVESVAICMVGALLGIGLGMLMGVGLNASVGALSGGDTTVPFVFVPEWYALAVFLGIFVGLIAGVYPAWRAAKVSPVEALRYE